MIIETISYDVFITEQPTKYKNAVVVELSDEIGKTILRTDNGYSMFNFDTYEQASKAENQLLKALEQVK